MTERPDRALFSDVRAALTFALNFEDNTIPGPVMNREMAITVPDRAKAEAAARSYTVGARRASNTSLTPKSVPLGGTQDRAVMAGWILHRFIQLEVVQRLVLTLTVMRPRIPCSCGSACCRGWTIKLQWVEAVRILAEHLKEQAKLDQEPGKRGYSVDPRLRTLLVEDYAKKPERRASLATMADITECSTATVARHRALIHGYLAQAEDAAWAELAAIFDAHGITGYTGD